MEELGVDGRIIKSVEVGCELESSDFEQKKNWLALVNMIINFRVL